MARPIVLVFQELAAPQATPTIPDLNTVIVGPVYDLLDYPDDAASILLTQTYGLPDQSASYVPPTSSDDTVTVLDGGYPAQTAGALVDHASVAVTLKYPRVVLGSTNASVAPAIGTSATTYSTDETLVALVGSVSGEGFVAAGVRAGDRVILTSSYGTVVRVVGSVGEPNGAGLVPDAASAALIRLTANLPSGWNFGVGLTELRVERELPIQTLLDPSNALVTFPEPGSDKMVLKGGIDLDVTITPVATVAVPHPSASTVTRSLSYSQIYLAYRALRQDAQDLVSFDTSSFATVNGIPTITGLGKIDARNPLAVGVSVALQNSGTAPIFGYGVSSNDLVGHASARAAMSSRRDLFCFVPLTQDLDIHAAYKTEFDDMADPLSALENGVTQKFRIVVGSVPLPTATTIYEGSISGAASQPSGAATGLYRTVTITHTGAFGVTTVLPGDTITIGLTDSDSTFQNRRGTHLVSHVNDSDGRTGSSDTVLEIVPGSSRWDSTTGSAGSAPTEIEIRSPSGALKLGSYAHGDLTDTVGVTTSTVSFTMSVPTVVGGPYTVKYLVVGGITAVVVALTGFTIVISVDGTTHTTADVVSAVNAHTILSTLLVASTSDDIVVANTTAVPVRLVPTTCVTSVTVNDNLYNRLDDTSATFLTAGVHAGDTLELPLDPNDYSPGAYDGRKLTYTIASVLTENRLLIANGNDDSATTGSELPHFYSRDLAGRYLTISGTNALNYRIRRLLSKDAQVLALTTTAQSVRSKRCTITWPDTVQVSDLRNGALTRAVAATRALAGDVPGYYIGCQVGGACAGLPAQHGLTNLGLSGVNVLRHSQGYFTERQLSRLSDGGFFVMVQHVPGALPICIHQLTTDPTALETGELSVVKNIDFVSKFFLDLLEPFIGVYNVTAATQNAIYHAVNDGAGNLAGRSLDRIGPPLISGTVTSIKVSDFDASRIELYFRGIVPRPLNTIAFHLVV